MTSCRRTTSRASSSSPNIYALFHQRLPRRSARSARRLGNAMQLKATYEFNAPIQTAWDLLMDTAAIAHCLPGCRGLRPIGDDRYEVELKVAIAAIAGDFKGTVALAEQHPPDSYKLVVEGSGR